MLNVHLHGAVHRPGVRGMLVEEEGGDHPRMAKQFSCVPSWLVAAENVLEVTTRDAVDQDLQGTQIQAKVEKSVDFGGGRQG